MRTRGLQADALGIGIFLSASSNGRRNFITPIFGSQDSLGVYVGTPAHTRRAPCG